ncbi:MAG TPA: hypothetical protein VJL80_06850 [Aeromicrobium sp.]|nr:hypothetical protein [Aeromicrobium sp.]HKY57737.1 hypothetical protein [Aeromicrobium sp.]
MVLSASAIVGLVMTSAVVVGGVLAAAERSSASIQMVADPTAAVTSSRAAYRVPRIALPSAPPASEVTVTGATFVFHEDAADLYALPDDTTEVVVVVAPDSKVGTTGETRDGFSQVVYANKVGWMKSDSLVTGRAISSVPCPSGSGVEKGLQPDTIRVHRAICTIFPQIKSFGGVGGGGEHAAGRALDVMTKDIELGTAIANMARQHWRELGISQIIWQQHIWTAERGGDSWRPMKSRGSDTANHKDHVHLTTFGNAGSL